MRTAVIILNWNTREQLERWLPGIVASCESVKTAEVVIADNGSSDGSVEFLKGRFPNLTILSFEKNLGFTGGYNRAVGELRDSNPELEYAVLINSDIEVSEGWLQPLIDHMDSNKDHAACGPKILALAEGNGKYLRTDRFEYAGAAGGCIDRFGYPFCKGRVMKRTEKDCGQYDGKHDVLWVSGACMMVRVSLWGTGLDPRFFAHMEEIDWCWRKQLEGYRIAVVTESKVWHLGGGTLAQDSPFKLKLNYRNNLLLLDNNLAGTVGNHKAGLTIFIRMILDGCSAIVYLLGGRKDYFKAVIAAHKEYRDLKSTRTRATDISEVKGFYRISIILQNLLRREGVFEYLRKYENSH